MTDSEILTKAIQGAVRNGWDPMTVGGSTKCTPEAVLHWIRDWPNERIVYNHDFAKALWGEDEHTASPGMDSYGAEPCENCGYEGEIVQPYCWHHHLMRMVIAEDPIAYLGEHLDG